MSAEATAETAGAAAAETLAAAAGQTGSADAGARAVLRAVAATEPVHPVVVLVDGGSGSGKTTLAAELVRLWPRARLLRLDDVYPGWHGLEAASRHLLEHVLLPLRAGKPARWRRWDWAAGAPAEWTDLDPGRPLVVEGSGALSRVNRANASVGVWIELDAATRKTRALARDGELYAPWWNTWAAQERAFAARERPRESADLELDGSAFEVVGRGEQSRAAPDHPAVSDPVDTMGA